MKKIFRHRLALLMLPALLAATPTADQEAAKRIATGNNAFAFDLFSELASDSNENIFISPFSISTALAMTYAGAQNETAKTMARTMHFGEQSPAWHMDYGRYIKQIELGSGKGVSLRTANRLWGDLMFKPTMEYLDMSKTAYGSAMKRLDFRHQAEASREVINHWVERETENKIQDLLPQGAVNPLTRLVLTNAIYFKGDWAQAFDGKRTKDRAFTKADGSKVTVPFMQQTSRFAYAERDYYQMLRLPYKGNKQSMIVVLPNSGKQLPKLTESLQLSDLEEMYGTGSQEVEVYLPKFKMTLPLKLSSSLKAMGMELCFSDQADYSGISKQEGLKISEVIHKAFIEVDEVGTEAAAATAVVMQATSSAMQERSMPKVFNANRPFLFYIVDDATGSILFMGRLMNPAN